MSAEINTDEIKPLAYLTEKYKIDNAFKLGQEHANYHHGGEPVDEDWPFHIHSWATCPYTKERADVYYSWKAGFYSKWYELINVEG